jgi:divalent metal cation (Fe/Co/Zn/Cd) transporter
VTLTPADARAAGTNPARVAFDGRVQTANGTARMAQPVAGLRNARRQAHDQLVSVDPQRQALIRRAFRLEWLSVGWMAVEAAVAVASGIAARSVTLVAFGLDSVIELASAGVLIWRLSAELRFGREVSEGAERVARRIAGGLLFALAAYVVAAAGWSLRRAEGEAFSWPGLAIALLSIPIMLVLAHRKLALADQLGSRALRADAAESVACLWLSVVVVAGLLAQLAFGAWWIDAVTSLAIVWFLVNEGREAWEIEEYD